jgi:DNA-binding NtrC family response regulator
MYRSIHENSSKMYSIHCFCSSAIWSVYNPAHRCIFIYMSSDSTLHSWLGAADLAASQSSSLGMPEGPTAQTARQLGNKKIILFCTWDQEVTQRYCRWLHSLLPSSVSITLLQVNLPSPTDHSAIYQTVCNALEEPSLSSSERCYLLSAGTPAMASIWLLVSQSRFPGRLFESSIEAGVKEVHLPFELSVEFLPQRRAFSDKRLVDQAGRAVTDIPALAGIHHQSEQMRDVLALCYRMAQRRFPVLIQGESGTGKEMIARAIHESGPHHREPFVAVNCGAIPEGLVESELFGHMKGAFTGAITNRTGHFAAAERGSLFLDEIGELPLSTQVKLLRVIQEQEVLPVGGSKPIPVRARILAATHRNLVEEVAAGRFREDLYYRVAVGLVEVPPLRERVGDAGLLLDHFLELVNNECIDDPDFTPKVWSPASKALLLQHRWPGNAREMHNAVRRIFLWSDGDRIEVDSVRSALRILPVDPVYNEQDVVPPAGIDLRSLLAATARRHLKLAMQQSGGKKVEAARLLGLPNHQMLTNWLKRHGLEP